MVKLIIGMKGSGKTKKLVDLIRETVAQENGDVICIENERSLTYDVPHEARLIDASEYSINTYDRFQGFICGIRSGNYDITHIFVENFFKIVKTDDEAKFAEFLTWLTKFAESEQIEVVMTASADPAKVQSDIIKSLVIE